MYTAGGGVSNHSSGRAVDIAAINGVPCTVVEPTSPWCGTMAQALAQQSPIPPTARPS